MNSVRDRGGYIYWPDSVTGWVGNWKGLGTVIDKFDYLNYVDLVTMKYN